MCSNPGLPSAGSKVAVFITRVSLNPDFGLVELCVKMDIEKSLDCEQMKVESQAPQRVFCGMEGKPGDVCLVRIRDTWHRACILTVQSETYEVFLTDQGQPHNARPEALGWVQNHSSPVPLEIQSCILANVLSLENDRPEKAARFLTSLPGNRFTGRIQHMQEGTLILDIPLISKFMCTLGAARKIPMADFNHLVFNCLHAKKESHTVSQDRTVNFSILVDKNDEYFYPLLSNTTYETVFVTEVIDPENIYCKLQIFSEAEKTMSDQIRQHYEGTSDFVEAQPLTLGEPCAAKGPNGQWRRSLLKQNIASSDSTVEVFYVDEGKTDFVPTGAIRPLHGKFLRMPVVTYLCSLRGINGNETGRAAGHADHLKSQIHNKMFAAKFEQCNAMHQHVYYVTLYAASINSCCTEKAQLFPSSENENILHDPNLDTGSSHEETLPSGKNQTVSERPKNALAFGNGVIHTIEDCDPLDSLINNTACLPTSCSTEKHCDLLTEGSTVNVKVSHIESPQKFWCQITENSDSLKLLMEGLQNRYASPYRPTQAESIRVARNPGDDMWCRARILARPSPVVKVRFIDYGGTQIVPLGDVRSIDPAFLQPSVQAFRCSLYNVTNSKNSTWSGVALAEFKRFVESGASSQDGLKCTVKSKTYHKDGSLVYLVDLETQHESICDLLAQKCSEAKTRVPPPPPAPSDTYSYSTHDIEVGMEEKAFITSSQSVNHFYCQLHKNSHLLDKVMQNINRPIVGAECTEGRLGLNSICLARALNNNKWCRGEIVEISPELKVHFADYGDTITMKESDIRPFPADACFVKSIPAQALPLELSDVPTDVPQEVNQWFSDQAVGQNFTISVVAKGERGKLIVVLLEGSQSLNVRVRERIADIQQQMTSPPEEDHQQQLLNKSGQPDGNSFALHSINTSESETVMQQNNSHNSNGLLAEGEPKMNSKFKITDTDHGKTSKEASVLTLDSSLRAGQTVLDEMLPQGDHVDPETAQCCDSLCQETVEDCTYKKPKISPNKTEDVYATCIVGPHYFWCQLADAETLNVVSELAWEAGQAERDREFPKSLEPGSPCLAPFSGDEWYRAQVVSKTDNIICVLYVDYGNESEVNAEDVKAIPQRLLDLPPRAFSCSLNGFDESKGSWNDDVYDDFYNFLVDKLLRLTVLNVQHNAEITFPQYTVKIEWENVDVNSMMEKHWRPSTDCDKTEMIQKGISFEVYGISSNETNSKEDAKTPTYEKPNISQKEKQDMYASCVVDPHYFWCQYTNSEELDTVSRFAQEAGQVQQDMTFLENMGPGNLCLAMFSDNNQWYRAKVIHRGDDSVHVVFIDYGNKADVEMKNVRSLPQSLLELPPQAFLCSLSGFDKSAGSWDGIVCDYFVNLLVDKPLRVTLFSKTDRTDIAVPQYAVEIECEGGVINEAMQKYWKPMTNKCIMSENTQGAFLQHESIMINGNLPPVNVNPFMYKKPDIFKNKTETVYASCIVGPSFFWCQYDNTENLEKVARLAQEAGKSKQETNLAETLRPDSPCLALYSCENRWYRAQVTHRMDNGVRVVFVDYGNESDVEITDVRSLPHSLLEPAPQAFLCSLNGFDESKGTWDGDVYEDFFNLLVDKLLKVSVQNVKNNPEIAFPQYEVDMECEGVVLNTAMEKYWKES